MELWRFVDILKTRYWATDAKVLKCAEVAYDMACDAFNGEDLEEEQIRYIGYGHFIELIESGEYDIEKMQFTE